MKIDLNTKTRRRWFAIAATVAIAELFTLWGIYGIEEYGIFLFFLVPFFIGFAAPVLYGYKDGLTFKEARSIAFVSLAFYCLGLLCFAIEGMICILMAAPLGILLTWTGSIFGHMIIDRHAKNAPTTLLILMIAFPGLSFLEKDAAVQLTSVVSSIEIAAPPQTVWKNVIEFPELKQPTELIFKTGIAYPINAKIDGKGIGAVRHCNFTTGSFVEPITVWNEPHLLRFTVAQQPAPMKELSFWDVDAPHLHDYFVSRQGQFRLIQLPNGNTLLEGTTWYHHDIKPSFYWSIWSEYIVHKIHHRVLEHIKTNSEK